MRFVVTPKKYQAFQPPNDPQNRRRRSIFRIQNQRHVRQEAKGTCEVSLEHHETVELPKIVKLTLTPQ